MWLRPGPKPFRFEKQLPVARSGDCVLCAGAPRQSGWRCAAPTRCIPKTATDRLASDDEAHTPLRRFQAEPFQVTCEEHVEGVSEIVPEEDQNPLLPTRTKRDPLEKANPRTGCLNVVRT